jgi:acyl-CoA synthetase (AMP-forming)/AMP-acid ligase II
MNSRTLPGLLAAGRDEAVAIAASGAAPLTYAGLRELVGETIASLNGIGIGRGDRVAIVLPNGPEMATAFLAVASAATSAPLNPAYRAEEFEFYMSDLGAKALVVEAGGASPALAAAGKLGIAILTLTPDPERGAGAFRLSGETLGSAARPGPAEAHDIALILHTSGTTSRPKIVPLSQANVTKSADNIAASLEFTEADRGLNVMPLFHIHGLIASLLAPLSRGGSVFCTPGFNALKFFAAMEAAKPTWYTAVPTMHQALLTRAAQNKAVIARHPLRFIRSSSASLPPRVIGELEAAFNAPVIEAYGMTEASHQMAANPLRGVRKPGSVGLAAGPEITIMDEAGEILAPGRIGEIVIRGESVTAAYENNAKANAEAFVNGWFRTGDQGVIDAEGYVTLTGRLKEIISRGGEKISPREVDEALMDHPAVLQVVTFGVPHEMLGEDVAAAVVLREGASASEAELRAFLSERIAAFKTPRKILFLAEIPKGATGKLQRIGLAQKLGLA